MKQSLAPQAEKPRFSFVPLETFHVEQIRRQPHQSLFKQAMDARTVAALVAGGPRGDAAKALFDGEHLVACAGLIDETEGRARAWALIGPGIPALAWPLVIATMRSGIDQALDPSTGWAHRVAAETTYNWAEGHRLLLHLGFTFEGFGRGLFPGGVHGVMYARARGDVDTLPLRCRVLLQSIERCLWEDAMPEATPWDAGFAARARDSRRAT